MKFTLTTNQIQNIIIDFKDYDECSVKELEEELKQWIINN